MLFRSTRPPRPTALHPAIKRATSFSPSPTKRSSAASITRAAIATRTRRTSQSIDIQGRQFRPRRQERGESDRNAGGVYQKTFESHKPHLSPIHTDCPHRRSGLAPVNHHRHRLPRNIRDTVKTRCRPIDCVQTSAGGTTEQSDRTKAAGSPRT